MSGAAEDSAVFLPSEPMNEQENGGATGSREEDSVVTDEATGAAGEEEVREPSPSAPAGDEASAMRERHLRLAAEFDNYRKRVERERSESWVRAQAQLVERLLEPLDDLQRIVHQEVGGTSASALQEAAMMVKKKFFRQLEGIGVEVIEAEGRPFDPTIHEALTTVPTEDEAEDNTVAEVYQNGYLLKGVLIRPSRVVVRKHG
jgi:molecular chaperone GrpE